MVRALIAVLLASAAGSAQAQQIRTYTNNQSGTNLIPLGFPVPLPVESLTPVDGFRNYDSLFARTQDLMLASPEMSGAVSGQTLNGRQIWAYRIGDANRVGAEGRPEPVVLIEGGIHAREWQSPEVVTGLIESLIESSDLAGLDRFLLDEVQLLAIPVLNVDGFLMTQQNPARVWVGQDITDPDWPRDGRMRRKNLRNSDTNFDTAANHLGGVDLNRNNAPYWATSTGSTSNPAGLTYHGINAASEPEIQAVLAAAQSAPLDQLRVYVGAHSFSQVLFTIITGNTRRNVIQNALAADFSAHHRAISISTEQPNGRTYFLRPDQAGFGIGQTSEYFANQVQVPAWTLEIEPLNGAIEYGSFGYHHDGFILPNSQIRRVREQLSASHRVLLYHAAGPASVRLVQISDLGSGEVVYRSRWRANGNARVLDLSAAHGLVPGGNYRIQVAFDRPMRDRVNGQSLSYPGQIQNLQPTLSLINGGRRFLLPVQSGQWLGAPTSNGDSFLVYREDSFVVDFSLPADYPAGTARLEVDASDLLGRNLDANPSTAVGWSSGHWTGYESSSLGGAEGDSGGGDISQTISVHSASRIALLDGPRRLLEGGGITLEFARLGPANGTARLQLGFAPVEGIAANVVELQWADGESGAKQILLSAGEDTVSEADYGVSVSMSVVGAEAVASSFQLLVQDNDDSTSATIRIGETLEDLGDSTAGRLRWALQQAQVAQRLLRIELPAGEMIFHPPSGAADQSLAVTGSVRLIGAGSELIAVGTQPVLQVVVGASLAIEDLVIHDAGASPLLVSNQGTLDLLRTRLQAPNGTALATSGTLSLGRSSVEAAATGVDISAGSATLSDSTLYAINAGPAALLKIAANAQASGSHLSLVGGSSAALSIAGSLSLQDSLLAGSTSCELSGSGGFQSGGGNLSQVPICGAVAAGDQVAASLDVGAYDSATGSLPPGPGLLALASTRCPLLDQLAAPRGGSCAPGSRSLEPSIFRGLWWNPARPGHGQHIEIVDGVAFVLWYTYDINGLPLTLTAQGVLVDGVLVAPLLRWRRQEITRAPVFTEIGSLRLVFNGNANASLNWNIAGQGEGVEPLEPFHFFPDEPLRRRSGLYADFQDFGWGLTVQEEGPVAFALLYFFAADQQLRWASAQGDGGASAELIAFGQTGSCMGCPFVATAGASAGWILLNDRGDGRLGFNGQVQLSVQPGGAWTNQAVMDRFARR